MTTTPDPPQRGYAKGRARREEILETARALFGEVGYRSASLREIAARCGISHPGLLHHFPTKEALLEAVLVRRDAVSEERFGVVSARGTAALRALVEVVAANAAEPGEVELYCVLSAEATAPDHPAHRYFADRYEVTRASTQRSLREAAEDGDLREGVDPAVQARVLVAVMDGLQVQWLLDRAGPTPTDMPAALRAHLSTLLTHPLP
ncbi:TetR/AcrR family transcriptional regulator [Quadrisphaera sp. INWT6]|uniref:TetR/AcrR family transcriptional regulator n=1 Tax=Quadrisphaera sp. INWT6 TaxID=2596917 RepID=UPI00189280EC|nr:TetR/AcrR family transcriptional regulator [Quadrisphaera sp. INWT6]MBF5082011.1 TetR/AcrR family transcriptional regulator [Quadrisphaera sp. INWT6]